MNHTQMPKVHIHTYTYIFKSIGDGVHLLDNSYMYVAHFVSTISIMANNAGFDYNSAATLLSLFAAGCAIKSFLGGVIED